MRHPVNMMRCFLDRLLFPAVLLRTRIRERRRWSRAAGVRRGPAVHYGYDRLPARTEEASGGIVKCQDLAGIYPNTPRDPNLLYLVSSALPPLAPVMVKSCRIAGGRVVLNQNGVVYPGWYGPGWEEANRPMAEVHRLADHVFYQSDFCRAAAQQFLGARQGPSEVLHNPVDTSAFAPRGDRPRGQGPVLLIAGSHHFRYRMTTSVDAFAGVVDRLPDARLVVAGKCAWRGAESESIADLERYAVSRNVRSCLDITGPYTQAQAPGVFRAADVLLHTKYNDPCPRVVVEAMACGLPIVFSATGGGPELVGPAGVGIPGPLDWEADHPPSADSLSAAVLEVMQDYDRLSATARERAVSTFGVAPWLARHRAVFESLVATEAP